MCALIHQAHSSEGLPWFHCEFEKSNKLHHETWILHTGFLVWLGPEAGHSGSIWWSVASTVWEACLSSWLRIKKTFTFEMQEKLSIHKKFNYWGLILFSVMFWTSMSWGKAPVSDRYLVCRWVAGTHWVTAQLQPSRTFSKWNIIMQQTYTHTHCYSQCVSMCRVVLWWCSTLTRYRWAHLHSKWSIYHMDHILHLVCIWGDIFWLAIHMCYVWDQAMQVPFFRRRD